MITKTITYKDFNEKEVTETLSFHFKKADMLDNLEIADEFEELRQLVEDDPDHILTKPEVKMVLTFIKKMINFSYGIRVDGGAKFRQTPEILQDFKDSEAYDAFLFSLFEDNASGANNFLIGILPQDTLEAARAEQAKRAAPQDHLPKQSPAAIEPTKVEKFDDTQVEGSNVAEDPAVTELKRKLAELEAAKQD